MSMYNKLKQKTKNCWFFLQF